jgi:hypothetical protein
MLRGEENRGLATQSGQEEKFSISNELCKKCVRELICKMYAFGLIKNY